MAAVVGTFEAGDGVIGTGRFLNFYRKSSALTCMDGVRMRKKEQVAWRLPFFYYSNAEIYFPHSCASIYGVPYSRDTCKVSRQLEVGSLLMLLLIFLRSNNEQKLVSIPHSVVCLKLVPYVRSQVPY